MSTTKVTTQDNHEVVNKNCAGIDVHRDFVSVTIICEAPQKQVTTEYREFRTIKQELLLMRDWLLDHGCTVVGIESTGKYWFPVHNVLEDVMDVHVYNARNMKNLPGKKTDKADSEWIAKITRHMLLQSSYIPDKQIRDARLLSRTRKSLVQMRSQVRQMILGAYDASGIKLSSVVSDVFGTSGRNLTNLLLSGGTISEDIIKSIVYGPLCHKTEDIMLSMDGYLREVHTYIISLYLRIEQDLTGQIEQIEAKLYELLVDSPQRKELLDRIVLIPGFTERSALILLSEVGFDLRTFDSNKKFCSWAGLAPGKHESAGKNRSGKIQVRQRYLRALLIEVSLAATHCKDTFIKAKYYSLKSRIGANKAVVAIAHFLAEAAYRAIKEGMDYKELTSAYVSQIQMNRDLKNLSRITDRLGKDTVLALVNKEEGTI